MSRVVSGEPVVNFANGKAHRTPERTAFRTSRLLDFCSEKELTAQTGHEPSKWTMVIGKELADNGIDACEDIEVAPELTFKVHESGIEIRDNGPGLPPEIVEGILDFSIRISTREAYVGPCRGAQGNALKTLVAMPFVLDGNEGKTTIEAKGIRHEIGMKVDRIKQEPLIDYQQFTSENVKNGTSVKIHWPDTPRYALKDAGKEILQIVNGFTFLNPHLTTHIEWFEFIATKPATDPSWKKWKPSDPPCGSAHWYDLERFKRLIAAVISDDRDKGRDTLVRDFIKGFRGLKGSAKQKAVLDRACMARKPLSHLADEDGLKDEPIQILLNAMLEETEKIKPAQLGIIGKDHLAVRFEMDNSDMKSFQYKRVMGEDEGIPFVLETAFAYRENDESKQILGVNWSPCIGNPFRQLAYGGLDGLLQEQRIEWDSPTLFFMHLASARVDYLDRGKSALVIRKTDVEEDDE
jgi:DNA topoisomerase VI subunit B